MGKCIIMETSDKDPTTSQGTVTKDNLIKGWKKARIILREFKEMFENRYLLNLRERYSHHPKEPRVTSKLAPKIGQIVQIKGDTKNRINWKVGKIVSLKEGADGLCRVAKVRVGDTEYTRSIAHLYPLEIEDGEEQCKQTSSYEESVEELVQLPDLPRLSGKEDVTVESLKDVAESPSEQRLTQEVARDQPEEEVQPHASPVEEECSSKQIVESRSSELNEPKPKSMSEPEPLAVVDLEFYDHTDPESHHLEEVTSEGQHEESRPKRAAALRALEKIKEWTSNLVAVLLPEGGSVATDANI
ncbi:high mobility group nucleosome-binding domain-containing protein 5-like [Cydia amplana]|uniref:high mobility group nucleosome-binding domain-containing protein 5-like n=1 Tax=Cydia amplana TaxID=1869771 RepID=UPI002FE6BF0E